MPSQRQPYPAEPGQIGVSRSGASVSLAPMTDEAAEILGTSLAAIDPWARAKRTPEHFTTFFAAKDDAGARRYQILADGRLAGAIVVRSPWLSGSYLQLLGMLPGSEGQGVGSVTLDWLVAQAQEHGKFRNVWLCVSSFNTEAQRLYRAHGFEKAALLDDLAIVGIDELLMRKRLS